MSQSLEEAEQLHCSVGGSSRVMQECSCPNKGGLCCELYQVDISDPVPASGAASWHCQLLLCCPGASHTPEGQQPGEGVGLAAALPSREAVQLSH